MSNFTLSQKRVSNMIEGVRPVARYVSHLLMLSVIPLIMDVQRMDIQRLPSFEVMIVTATWICAS